MRGRVGWDIAQGQRRVGARAPQGQGEGRMHSQGDSSFSDTDCKSAWEPADCSLGFTRHCCVLESLFSNTTAVSLGSLFSNTTAFKHYCCVSGVFVFKHSCCVFGVFVFKHYCFQTFLLAVFVFTHYCCVLESLLSNTTAFKHYCCIL